MFTANTKKLKLPVRYVDGKWELKYGGEFPVDHGATGELVVAQDAITDKAFLRRMLATDRIMILERGAVLRVCLAIKDKSKLPEKLRQHLIPFAEVRKEISALAVDNWSSSPIQFVEVEIGPADAGQQRNFETRDRGLWLLIKGMEADGLRSSTIVVSPDIMENAPVSLNHAFTRLSELYEPWRISHTGSAYKRFLYRETNGLWYPLELLRDASLAAKEQEIAYGLWQEFLARMSARDGSA